MSPYWTVGFMLVGKSLVACLVCLPIILSLPVLPCAFEYRCCCRIVVRRVPAVVPIPRSLTKLGVSRESWSSSRAALMVVVMAEDEEMMADLEEILSRMLRSLETKDDPVEIIEEVMSDALA